MDTEENKMLPLVNNTPTNGKVSLFDVDSKIRGANMKRNGMDVAPDRHGEPDWKGFASSEMIQPTKDRENERDSENNNYNAEYNNLMKQP